VNLQLSKNQKLKNVGERDIYPTEDKFSLHMFEFKKLEKNVPGVVLEE
jgi:hypothetical protein